MLTGCQPRNTLTYCFANLVGTTVTTVCWHQRQLTWPAYITISLAGAALPPVYHIEALLQVI